MAPELAQDATPASDMYALGRTIRIVMALVPSAPDDPDLDDLVAALTSEDPSARRLRRLARHVLAGAWHGAH